LAQGLNLILDLAWSRLGVEPAELSEIVENREVFRVLRTESPSGMCAKLRTVAASINRDHAPQSLCY